MGIISTIYKLTRLRLQSFVFVVSDMLLLIKLHDTLTVYFHNALTIVIAACQSGLLHGFNQLCHIVCNFFAVLAEITLAILGSLLSENT